MSVYFTRCARPSFQIINADIATKAKNAPRENVISIPNRNSPPIARKNNRIKRFLVANASPMTIGIIVTS